jgi:hypothetical protein
MLMTSPRSRDLLARLAYSEAREWREARTGVVSLSDVALEAAEYITAAALVYEVDATTERQMMAAFLHGAESTGLPLRDSHEARSESITSDVREFVVV